MQLLIMIHDDKPTKDQMENRKEFSGNVHLKMSDTGIAQTEIDGSSPVKAGGSPAAPCPSSGTIHLNWL